MMRWVCWLLLVALCIVGSPASPWTHGAVSGTTTWATLKIGAGGFITGIDIVGSVMVNRTDTYGGYAWNGSSWAQLVTIQSMPAAQAGLEKDVGIAEIRIAPSNTARFYMIYNGQAFRSDSGGATWTLLSNYAIVTWSANDNSTKTFGPFIAVDPANADVVFISSPAGGLRYSSDAGATWATVATVAAGGSSGLTQGGGNLVAFDPTSAVSGGKTQGVFATSYGTGVYHSTNGGTSWTFLNTSGMPTTHCHLIIDQNGVLWMTDSGTTPSGSCQGHLNKYASGAWTTITPGSQGTRSHSVAVDPSNANNIYVGMDSGDIISSANGGSSWTDPNFNNTRTATAPDPPWLAWTKEVYMTNGDMKYSGSTLIFGEGIGVWKTVAPGATTAWTSQSAGIEQLVSNKLLKPPSGGLLYAAWDRPMFYTASPTTYPSTVAGCANPQANAIVQGGDMDYASATPATIFAICNVGAEESGRSTDGGQTWTKFATVPTNVLTTFLGGSIAASTSTNAIWIPANNDLFISYTTDGGATWTQSTATGTKTTGAEGWSNSYVYNRRIACADRVTANKFYAYYNGTANSNGAGTNADGAIAGIYVSTDSGAIFTKAFSGRPDGNNNTGYSIDFFNSKLRCVPGNAGHMFFAAGQVGGSTSGGFWRSTDAGATLTAMSGVLEVYAFGFGKVCPAGTYPAIYIAGFVSSTWGIYRSCDGDQVTPTWTSIGDGFPLGNFSEIRTVEGDPDTYGTVYVGTLGAGVLYGKLNFLLKRDLDPASNDNTPMWLNVAA